ncbi:hypothetical protein SAMN03159496_05070 [Rhizobium sp. NFR07]|nr:hypothetical protein SAMN03159496_05070 [Rhizobium sp. NFR07]
MSFQGQSNFLPHCEIDAFGYHCQSQVDVTDSYRDVTETT